MPPRKQANAGSKEPSTTSSTGDTKTDADTVDLDALRAKARARASAHRQPTQNPISYKLFVIFLLVPLASMLWSAEAPRRPFSLLTTPRVGAAKSTSGEEPALIEPRVLLLTAHPDDEILFAPTVLDLLSEEKKATASLWSLCLSTGDFGGGAVLGQKRRAEWNASWTVLGLDEDKRTLLDVPKLKDNPEFAWEPAAIADHVAHFVLKHDIDTILTFDDEGVTGHPNHASLSSGVKHMLTSPSFTKKLKKGAIFPRLFVLKSYPAGSHLSFLSAVVEHLTLGGSALMSDFRGHNQPGPDYESPEAKARYVKSPPTVFVGSLKGYYRTWKALLQHRSQLSPKFFVLATVGKNVWVNEWTEVEIAP